MNGKKRFSTGSMLVVALLAIPIAAAADFDGDTHGDTVVPVLLESPACEHAKLGLVSVHVGERVNEGTQDPNVPTTTYQREFAKLADAAREKGADAVVLRQHQAVLFTRNGKRSQAPVYIKLHGAVIGLPDASQCELVFADAAELQWQARDGKAANVSARDAFSTD